MKTGSLRDERFLVTGAFGCIGVWVLRELLAAGAAVVAADLASDSPRLALVLDDVHDRRLGRVQLDVTDLPRLVQVLDDHRITRLIHLAALQVPFCRADPPRGAAVNVVGTVNVFEAVRRRHDWIPHVVYASSVAALDAAEAGDGSERRLPGTTYGVYKQANEQMAMRYWLDYRSPSIGLRPHTVFGPARDQGVTSAPTMAMLAAAAGQRYTIPYAGAAQFQYAPDVARAFVGAAVADIEGADVHNLLGDTRSVADLVKLIVDVCPEANSLISYEGEPLSFPAAVADDGLKSVIGELTETPLRSAVADTIAHFRTALADRRIDASILHA